MSGKFRKYHPDANDIFFSPEETQVRKANCVSSTI